MDSAAFLLISIVRFRVGQKREHSNLASRLEIVGAKGAKSRPRSDTKRAGDFAKRCFLGIADLNTSAKKAAAL
jgi:hypothetical protein